MSVVNLVSVSKPAEENYGPDATAEMLLAFIARVSNPKNQNNTSTGGKLLKYLVKNNHWSPFEMVHIVIEIECSRAIGRQILRHRSFSFQEFSQRYAEVGRSMFCDTEARLQDTKNRQNSLETNDENVVAEWKKLQEFHIEDSMTRYRRALEIGIAKEQARVLLPEGLTMSRMYMAGSLRSWIHYCELRMGNGTQKEHQDIAKECWSIITKEFPSLEGILDNNQ